MSPAVAEGIISQFIMRLYKLPYSGDANIQGRNLIKSVKGDIYIWWLYHYTALNLKELEREFKKTTTLKNVKFFFT